MQFNLENPPLSGLSQISERTTKVLPIVSSMNVILPAIVTFILAI